MLRVTQYIISHKKLIRTFIKESNKEMETCNRNSLDIALKTLVNSSTESISKDQIPTTREQTKQIMESYINRLNLDINKLSIIHVAGTKGKGSTCAFVESILREKGFKTGLFTSPHLMSPCERYRINGKPISDKLFLFHFWKIWDKLSTVSVDHSIKNKQNDIDIPKMANFFRFFTLMAFTIFIEEKVDVVILEVGIGGRLDATNVIQKPVVCGITTLDLDHTKLLGDTIDKIAFEKAGIMKHGIPIFTVNQEISAEKVLFQCAKTVGCPFVQVNTIDPTKSLGLKGNHQRLNASLAVALAQTWLHNKNQCNTEYNTNFIVQNDKEILEGLRKCVWPGRTQTLKINDSLFYYLDGAHTIKSMECCAEWYSKEIKRNSFDKKSYKILIFFCSHERDAFDLFKPLLQLNFDLVIFTPTNVQKPSFIKIPSAKDILVQKKVNGYDETFIQEPSENQNERKWEKTLASLYNIMSSVYNNKNTSNIIIKNSVKESIEYIHKIINEQNMFESNEQPDKEPTNTITYHVLATGSLYLVGNILSEILVKN